VVYCKTQHHLSNFSRVLVEQYAEALMVTQGVSSSLLCKWIWHEKSITVFLWVMHTGGGS